MNEKPARLMSLDALRGFDMWFITGGAAFVCVLCTALGFGDSWLVHQMRHVPWEGFHHHDTIFPLFLFLAGVSWPFSLAAQQAKGRSTVQIHLKVVRRAFTLFFFGLLVGGLLAFRPTFRVPSVLGYIGFSWGIAAILFMHLRSVRARIILVVVLVTGYWALLHFVGAPDAAAGLGNYCKEGNIISYLDRTLMPNHLHRRGIYDPESLFALPNGVALAFIGMCAGSFLRVNALTPLRKALALFAAAFAFFVLDLVFIYILGDPIVKALWTSSFILSAATYATFLLALFYLIIDVWGFRKWTLYFRVIGMNSITVYLFQSMFGFRPARDFFFGGLSRLVPTGWSELVLAAGYLIVVWCFLYILYRKNVFLKV